LGFGGAAINHSSRLNLAFGRSSVLIASTHLSPRSAGILWYRLPASPVEIKEVVDQVAASTSIQVGLVLVASAIAITAQGSAVGLTLIGLLVLAMGSQKAAVLAGASDADHGHMLGTGAHRATHVPDLPAPTSSRLTKNAIVDE
jgi:hypothetical protein